MNCENCDFVNPGEARFCARCGVRLSPRCPDCGAALVEGAAFCHTCGLALGARPARPAPATLAPAVVASGPPSLGVASAAPPASVAELRHVTVMFVDIVDSTGLSRSLDLEAYRELLAAFRRYVSRVAPELGGHVAQFMGDGAMIFFGYPVAREDAVACSIHCALEIASGAADLGGEARPGAPPIGLRISINSGPVVVDESVRADGSFSKDVFGDVPNVAERLKALAQPGEVVVSAATRRVVKRHFRFTDCGEHAFKGVEDKVRAFRVDGVASSSAAAEPRHAALFGRAAELGLLDQRWASAVEGDGQIVMLSGEAGIGKSAMVKTLRDRLGSQRRRELLLAGSAIRRNSAGRVLRTGFEALLGLEESDGDAARRARAELFLAEEGLDDAAYLGALVRVIGSDRDQAAAAPAEAGRRELNAALVALMLRLCARAPLLVVAEDLHWIDPSSLDFLAELALALKGECCLLLATFRPDFAPPWPSRPNMTALTIGRLSRRETMRLIDGVAGKAMPSAVVEQIVDRTDGVPLFVEELTKTVIESGLLRDEGDRFTLDGPLPALSIPESLQDSLMARLDRLAAVKNVAQIAAAIGRRFPHALLERVSGRYGEALDQALEQLTDAELIFRLRSHPAAEFEFKHALVQDAAYQSLLRSARQEWHRRIAETIERDFPHILDAEPEIVAHHWSEARDFSRGEAMWTVAAAVALARSANPEAIAHFRRALACLAEQPPSRERDRRELELLIRLAPPLAAARGYADAKVRETYARAEALASELGEDARLFPIAYGLFRSWMIGGDQKEALVSALQLRDVAARSGDRGHLAAAKRSVGAALFYTGSPAEALPFLEDVLSMELSEAERRSVLGYDVVDLEVACLAYAAWTRWHLGASVRAEADAALAIRLADEGGHVFSRVFARAFASWTHEFRGDRRASGALAAEALALSREHGFNFWIGWAEVMAASAEGGPGAAARIAQGISRWLDTGSAVGLPFFLSLKARALIDERAGGAAAEALDAAEAEIRRSGERWWRPEILRLRARLHEAEPARAAALLDSALEAARAMASGALALRVATDLAPLRGAEEVDLADLVARVEAGGATEDTRRARRLLRIDDRRVTGDSA